MGKFNFRLQAVLEVRAKKEEAAQRALARAWREYRRLLHGLNETKRRLEEASAPAGGVLDVTEQQHLALYRGALAERLRLQEKAVRAAAAAVEAKRREAVRARQERQVIEKVKEKRYGEFLREEAAAEAKINDELALYSFMRRRVQK